MDEHLVRLRDAPDLILDGNAYIGKFEIDNIPSIKRYLRTLDNLRNVAIPEPIRIGGRSANKLTSSGMTNGVYKRLLAHIPAMVEHAVAFSEYRSRKIPSHYPIYQDLVVGVELDNHPYTVRMILGKRRGYWYYAQFVTDIKKRSLINGYHDTNAGGQSAPFQATPIIKDTRLLEIVQGS